MGQPPLNSNPALDAVATTNVGRAQKRNLQQLKKVRQYIEELILLSDRRLCQELVGGLTTADKARYKAESQRLVTRVRHMVGAARSDASAMDLDRLPNHPLSQQSPQTQQTQIRVQLSSSLVRILAAFANTGKRPAELIERALWNDRDIQNAALLLRIRSSAASAEK